ncbi:MAG: ABC transporter ATP-binding protein [Opitutales bacterium]|nr:ABC transporter ATP-binding protein [Opitutales bacterium]
MKRYSRYLTYVKPKIWYLIGALLAGLLFGASSGFGMPVIFDKVLKRIFIPESGVSYSLWYVFGVAMLIPAIFLIRAITGYISGYLMSYVSLEVLRRIKQDLFSQVQDYPLSFFDKHTSGDLFVRLTNDTSSVQTILLSFASEMIRQPVQVIGALSFLVYMWIKKGEVVLLQVFIEAIPVCINTVQIIRKNLKSNAKQAVESLGHIAQLFNENLAAAHEVRVFNLQEPQKKKFWNMNMKFQKLSLKIAKYELLQQPLMEVLAATMVSVTFVYAYKAKIDFSTFAAIGLALYFTIDPIKRIIRMCTDFIKITPSFDRLNEVLDYVSTVPEPKNPVAIGAIKGDIEFKNVSFAYSDKTVLKDVNINIKAGTSCALVGESGAGKSTFAKLAMRFYDPTEGEVFADGVNLKDISSFDLRKNLGSVPQYPVLFNDTIFNNILLARPEAAKDEVYAAARAAYAHEFISELENGYDTIVGERGDRLSGGQKQRIAIARVFLKNPPFIVLDEATSALDVNSEAFIQKAIDNLMHERTMFVIAHRFSTIRNVQKIIVFKEGEIVDFGSHDELYERCAYYKGLYDRQSTGQ